MVISKDATSDERGRRVALVIGNGKYRNMTQLPNPGNDANEIASKLRAQGFEVSVSVNRSKNEMEQDLADFYRRSKRSALALFFYAGHGIQADGRNYLIPVDAEQPEDEASIHRHAIELEYVVGQVQRAAPASLVFLDACRNNPGLERRLSGTTRDALREVHLLEVPRGTVMVLYAASRGQRALDSLAGRKNSPFAEALLGHLGDGVAVQLIVTRVIGDVKRKTSGRQQPEMQGNLDEEIFLGRPGAAPTKVFRFSPAIAPAVSTVAPSPAAPLRPAKELPETEKRAAMLLIPAGTFTMGSRSEEMGRHEDEIMHTVKLNWGFWLGRTEVTQAQWEEVMGTNPAQHIGKDLPVEQVSWFDAVVGSRNSGR